ncbi:MAG: hypothetical protein KDD42_01540, partial [Bdellovibrionales bacterium]|nr:hypothetical protein [Bdellovibrionales bacterium]
TSLLTSKLTAEMGHSSSKADETGYLAGSFLELGTLLLAYYFPQVYENALKRSDVKKQDLAQSIQEIIGLDPVELSLEVLGALKLPDYYKNALQSMHSVERGDKIPRNKDQSDHDSNLGRALFASQKISNVLTHKNSKQELDQALHELARHGVVDNSVLNSVVGELPNTFKTHCTSIDLSCPPLPEYVSSYAESEGSAATTTSEQECTLNVNFKHFVDEIREAVESREPTASIITRVMETFAWSLNFDRVLLMLLGQGKKELTGRMILGLVKDNFDPKSIQRKIGESASSYAPDALAFKESRPIFNGDPIFEDGWPFAAIPIGFGQRSIGVIYADRINPTDDEVSGRDQAAIGVLAELLDRSVSLNTK